MIIGYYVFLGSGDYHPPATITKQWIFSWGVSEWKSFIDELLLLDTDTLLIYLNGHKLPYKSRIYPDLIEVNYLDNTIDFLPELFSYIKERGLKLIAVLTTTGHAGGFVQKNPESAIEFEFTEVDIEDTLVSFPEHIRKGKLLKKSGAAQLGYGVLCHNKATSRFYAETILMELLDLYGSYFDGVALHPPESAYPCYCMQCCNKFRTHTEMDLKKAGIQMARKFFISSYLEFQTNWLFSAIKKELTNINLYTFSIPWLFENVFEEISQKISKDITIIEWDYNLSPERLLTLRGRLQLYKKLGFKVLFMPSAGFSFNLDESVDEQINAIKNQLAVVEEQGIEGIVHFVGPKLNDYILQTSKKYLNYQYKRPDI